MPFEPGRKKTGGVVKGWKNQTVIAARESVEALLGGTIPDELIKIAQANPREKIGILIALLPYFYARLATVEINTKLTTSVEIKTKADELTAELMEVRRIS